MFIIIVLIVLFIAGVYFLRKQKHKVAASNTVPTIAYNALKDAPTETFTTIVQQPLWYYKVLEEKYSSSNKVTPLTETYDFTNADLITNKFNAEDWYRRRKSTLENQQNLLANTECFHTNITLFLVERYGNEVANTYLLKDANGLDNASNRLIEAVHLKNAGFNKQSPTQNAVIQNRVDSKNAYLGF